MPTPLFLPRRAPEAPSAPAARRFSGAAARGREAASLLLAAASAFAALALASFEAHPGRPEARGPDWVGPVGASLAGALVGTIGVVAWALVLEFALLAWPLLRGRASRATLARLAGDIVIMLIAAALVHVAAPEARAFGELAAGGALGELFGELLRSLFSTLGSFLVGLTAVGLVLIGRSSLSLTAWLEEARRLALLAARWLVVGYHALADLIRRWTTPVPVEVGAVAAEGAADLGSWGRQDGGPAWGREDGWGRDASTPPAPDARGGAPDTGSPPPAKAPSDPATSAPARRTRGRARAEEPDALAPPAPAGPVVVATRARNASRAALTAPDADEPRAENERPAALPVIHAGAGFVAPAAGSSSRASAAESSASRASAESSPSRVSAENAASRAPADSAPSRAPAEALPAVVPTIHAPTHVSSASAAARAESTPLTPTADPPAPQRGSSKAGSTGQGARGAAKPAAERKGRGALGERGAPEPTFDDDFDPSSSDDADDANGDDDADDYEDDELPVAFERAKARAFAERAASRAALGAPAARAETKAPASPSGRKAAPSSPDDHDAAFSSRPEPKAAFAEPKAAPAAFAEPKAASAAFAEPKAASAALAEPKAPAERRGGPSAAPERKAGPSTVPDRHATSPSDDSPFAPPAFEREAASPPAERKAATAATERKASTAPSAERQGRGRAPLVEADDASDALFERGDTPAELSDLSELSGQGISALQGPEGGAFSPPARRGASTTPETRTRATAEPRERAPQAPEARERPQPGPETRAKALPSPVREAMIADELEESELPAPAMPERRERVPAPVAARDIRMPAPASASTNSANVPTLTGMSGAPVSAATVGGAKVSPSATAGQGTVSPPERRVPSFGPNFTLPATSLLEPPPESIPREDPEALLNRARELEKVLLNYGVKGAVADIHTGPTVSTFEVIPAEGTKVSKVASLADDLALGLSCTVRIIAPIPGKSRIGFELPNRERIPVSLRELVEDRRFLETSAPLPVVLGRDIVGAPYFADLASMPHVIVAGATGAGKSVGLNVMLTSLLTRRGPDELRMLMIDPKVVELAPFDRIPHMLLPVVTDMKQASTALKWAVDEMERRYQLFANAGTKNIGTYNGWVAKARRGEIKAFRPSQGASMVGPDGSLVEVGPAREAPALPDPLPYIVIVVDEFADLMMQQGKDVEAAVARLAQKARAAGMHVILATQRPSVDVITGMIKANFPTRVAFRVAQRVDSRTILDEQGAEHLLGRGDMLVKMNGTNETRRVQCPFVSEEEVQRVTDFLRAQGEPVYDENILKPRGDDEEASGDDGDGELDPRYDEAVKIVAETRRCSTSWLQRKLGLGYNRAAKIVEAMEKRGLVGPAHGARDREVLIDPL